MKNKRDEEVSMKTIISGIVQQGKRMGRELGFPTANIAIPVSVQLPQDGVYIGMVTLEDGSKQPCILNQGKHPTLPEGQASIEAHLLDFEGDLYGKRISIEYLHRLRPEHKFPNVGALREQLKKDRADAQAWFAQNKSSHETDAAKP